MKKTIITILALLLSIFSAYSADFFVTYDFTYPNEVPNSVYIESGECVDATCSGINGANEIYSRNGYTCFSNLDPTTFDACIANYKITGNIGNNDGIIVKYNTNTVFGYNTYFHTQGDSYLAKYWRIPSFSCNFGICFSSPIQLNFQKKANAIAEIGQINIKNVDNANLPVQIEVPVKMDQTVCSAYQYTNSGMYTPTNIPSGYSDNSANTRVTLTINNANDNTQYYTQSINVPIEASTCAGLTAFSWTPQSTLVNTPVTFNIETRVIDNQVSSTIADNAAVTETIYPVNLDGTCWTRAYDFTLSNVNSFDLNTSVAQINVGESLFALFNAGAFRDNTATPMQFEARLFFNNNLVLQQLITTPTTGVQPLSLDLTSNLNNLPSGSYDVRLETSPVGVCTSTKEDVIQTQNLQLTNPQTYNVNFIIQNENNMNLGGASVQLELLNAAGNFVTAPTFNSNATSNSLGHASFTNLLAGTYLYTATAGGYQPVTNEIYVGTDANVYVTLSVNNSAPLIDLPQNITVYYQDTASINIKDYVMDANNAFGELTITSTLVSGSATLAYVNNYLTASTTTPNNAVVSVTVKDPAGATSTDSMTIIFSNNKPPVINTFAATVTNEATPVNTTFYVGVTDTDSSVTCSLDFGDGTNTSGTCSSLNGIYHVYTGIGTYTATLAATDGENTVYATQKIYVFERVNPAPHINYFKIQSSNGVIVPTDISLEWDVTHESNLPTTCTIRVLGVDTAVNCQSSMSLTGFNTTGTVTFNLIATDSNNNQVLRSVPITFYTDDVIITPTTAQLIMDDVVNMGEFKFSLKLPEEMMIQRSVVVVPVITCGGVDNYLNNADNILETSIISTSISGLTTFELTSNTRDYTLNVPADTSCTFSTVLVDDVGSAVTLSKAVTFTYPQEPIVMQSIRGKSTDIMNYMTTALAGEITKGYNSIEFTLSNNNNVPKEIVMTVISADLNVDYTQEEVLGPGMERNIHFPVFISENTKPGKYPVRIGVNDGIDKQVRYSYIIIQ